MADLQVRQQLQALGASIMSGDRATPGYFGKFVKSEIDKRARPIKASGAVIE